MKPKTSQTLGKINNRTWHLIDLKDQTLGRIATQIATLLIGKHKIDYSFHRDHGDYVVAINAADIQVTGKKWQQKIYYRHSGYTGNLKELTFRQLYKKDPRQLIVNAVANMLPQNRLKKNRLSRLKVFVDQNHPYSDKLK